MANDEAFRFVPRDPSSRFRGTNLKKKQPERRNKRVSNIQEKNI